MGKMKTAPKVLAKNQEKFRSVDIGRFQIRDSLEHIPSSLDSLMADLCNEEKFTFPILHQFKPLGAVINRRRKNKAFKLLKRKGVYPYEYFTTYQSITKSKYPPKEAFYSRLKEEHISIKDYNHGKQVYKFFQCKSMNDYMKLYCALDVILLAEIFIKYREMVIHHFELDPVYYLGKWLL